MAPPRLSDAQKQDLLHLFRAGSSSLELAEQFGCSTNTVTRIVKGLLEPAEYDALKRQRSRRPAAGPTPAQPGGVAPQPVQSTLSLTIPSADGTAEEGHHSGSGDAAPASHAEAAPGAALDPVSIPPAELRLTANPITPDPGPEGEVPVGLAADPDRREPAGYGLDDDARDDDPEDEYGDDDLDGDDEEDDEASGDDLEPGPDSSAVWALADRHAVADRPLCVPIPWSAAAIPDSVYMLVDKTVELQALPLAEIPELGPLAPEEQQRQALVVYANPRQAKRLCGRSQRVIKLPDTQVLVRTAPYLLAQGISRIVIEGSLYALPET